VNTFHFALIFIPFFLIGDIQQQSKVLHDNKATQAQTKKATDKLVSYGELSYFVLKDKVHGVGAKRCKQDVWPVVLAPRTRRLIGDLSNDRFMIRQRATDELMEIGHWNRIILLQEAGKAKDLESLSRLQRILESMP
jgi:hypothetical protein